MQAGVKVLFVFLLQSFIKNICASAHELRQLKVCATANRQGLPFIAGKAPYSGACWLGKSSVSGFWWVAAKIISGFCKVCAAAKCYRATAHRFHRQPRRCAKPLKKASLVGHLYTAAGKHNKRIVWDAFGAPHAGVRFSQSSNSGVLMYKGKLKSWNDERGFGFIKSQELSHDVFLHISSLKGMARKPRVGDIIIFEIEGQPNGKKKAKKCSIDGVSKLSTNKRSRIYIHSHRKNKSSLLSKLIIVLVVFCVVYGYQKFTTATDSSSELIILDRVPSIFESERSNINYTCSGKTHCSQMSSCEEAKFYQNNCPGTKMDGDHDGIPCERQLCNGW